MRSHTYSSMLLAISGAILMAVGLYFIVLRPALLPEDLNYMHASLAEIRAEIPGLVIWLPKVFWVLGGYIFSTGLLTLYISLTTFRADLRRPRGPHGAGGAQLDRRDGHRQFPDRLGL